MRTICLNREDFDYILWGKVYDRLLASEHPLRINGTLRSDDNIGIIMFQEIESGMTKPLDSIETGWPVGREIFDISTELNQRLLDDGKMVNHQWVMGATHIVSIPWGTMAGSGEAAYWDFYWKTDDVAATLETIRLGGKLTKLK